MTDIKIKENELYRMPKGFQSSGFYNVKEKLIDFGKSTSNIKDFDYAGSTINSFIGLQAYGILNTQLMANIAILESNIYTAKQRKSVSLQAQNKGYIPGSMTSSKLTIGMECTHRNDVPSLKIPRGTKFTGSIREGGDSFNFVTMEDVNVVRGEGGLYFPVVKLMQGRIMRLSYKFDSSKPLIIRDRKIDRDQVRVWVDSAEWTNWTHRNIVDVSGASTVFYMNETFDGETQIQFGVGVITEEEAGGSIVPNYIGGVKPLEGSEIVIEYLRTDGDIANGCRNFSYSDVIKDLVVENIIGNYDNDPDYVGSVGGGDIENIESIRENGRRAEEAQRRAVTDSDYLMLLDRKFSSIIQSKQVFHPHGSENNVFISIKPKNALTLTNSQRQDIVDYLTPFKMGNIRPVVVNPIYLFIKHDIKIYYNANTMNESRDWLKGKILDGMKVFYRDNVELFNHALKKSKLTTAIDNSDENITGSSVKLGLVREVMNYYQTSYVGIQFYNMIEQGSFESPYFEFITNPNRKPEDMEISYNIKIQSAKREGTESVIVVGPFRKGDVKAKAYTGDDIVREKIEDIEDIVQDQYYQIGTIDHLNDIYEWSFAKIGIKQESFNIPSLELHATPIKDDDIKTNDGALIVFENDLRPRYTNFYWDDPIENQYNL